MEEKKLALSIHKACGYVVYRGGHILDYATPRAIPQDLWSTRVNSDFGTKTNRPSQGLRPERKHLDQGLGNSQFIPSCVKLTQQDKKEHNSSVII